MTARLDRAALIEAVEAVMIREGGRLAEWHGWRCSYPEQYGRCDCNREVAADIVSELLPRVADAIETLDPHGRGDYDSGILDGLNQAAELVRSLLSTDSDQ